jgi:hypothetical protein
MVEHRHISCTTHNGQHGNVHYSDSPFHKLSTSFFRCVLSLCKLNSRYLDQYLLWFPAVWSVHNAHCLHGPPLLNSRSIETSAATSLLSSIIIPCLAYPIAPAASYQYHSLI